jgi:hypothetical protein
MQEERIKDGSTWIHKHERYAVEIEQSSPRGFTHYRRVVSIREDGKTFIRRPRTVNFLRKFEEAEKEE